MTTHTLLPKLSHIAYEISESHKNYVLYRHMPDKTYEFNVVKSLGTFRFCHIEIQYAPIPTRQDYLFLAKQNERIKKLS